MYLCDEAHDVRESPNEEFEPNPLTAPNTKKPGTDRAFLYLAEREGLAQLALPATFGASPPRRASAAQNARPRFVEHRVRTKSAHYSRYKKARYRPGVFVSGGERGIRTLDTG